MVAIHSESDRFSYEGVAEVVVPLSLCVRGCCQDFHVDSTSFLYEYGRIPPFLDEFRDVGSTTLGVEHILSVDGERPEYEGRLASWASLCFYRRCRGVLFHCGDYYASLVYKCLCSEMPTHILHYINVYI